MSGGRDLTELIGDTPLVRLRRTAPPHVTLLAKLEGQNPGGSVKDRAALSMLQGATDRGELSPGDRAVEATSGNTGIALAMLAGRFDLHLTLLMPSDATPERVRTMRAYGAEVILTPAERTIEHARERADAMVAAGTHAGLNQFANPDNPAAHERGTGPEIWRDTHGTVTHFVSAMGTTGTITGVGRYLKAQNEAVRIIGTQPTEGSSIPGIRRWSPEFRPEIFEPQWLDRTVDVSQQEAEESTRRLAAEEGIFAGVSSGGAFAAALRIAAELPADGSSDRPVATIVFIVCDRGDRYLSGDLFG
ncbi:MAG: cysteine synthase CysM [Trueperaceae bacterium]